MKVKINDRTVEFFANRGKGQIYLNDERVADYSCETKKITYWCLVATDEIKEIVNQAMVIQFQPKKEAKVSSRKPDIDYENFTVADAIFYNITPENY
jgi:hypothetical protein